MDLRRERECLFRKKVTRELRLFKGKEDEESEEGAKGNE